MKILYKIWWIRKEFAEPLVKFIDILPNNIYRDKLVSTNLLKLMEYTVYLNEMADQDEHYEVRSEEYEEF